MHCFQVNWAALIEDHPSLLKKHLCSRRRQWSSSCTRGCTNVKFDHCIDQVLALAKEYIISKLEGHCERRIESIRLRYFLANVHKFTDDGKTIAINDRTKNVAYYVERHDVILRSPEWEQLKIKCSGLAFHFLELALEYELKPSIDSNRRQWLSDISRTAKGVSNLVTKCANSTSIDDHHSTIQFILDNPVVLRSTEWHVLKNQHGQLMFILLESALKTLKRKGSSLAATSSDAGPINVDDQSNKCFTM